MPKRGNNVYSLGPLFDLPPQQKPQVETKSIVPKVDRVGGQAKTGVAEPVLEGIIVVINGEEARINWARRPWSRYWDCGVTFLSGGSSIWVIEVKDDGRLVPLRCLLHGLSANELAEHGKIGTGILPSKLSEGNNGKKDLQPQKREN